MTARVPALLLVSVLGLSACGSDDEPATTTQQAATTPTSTTRLPTPQKGQVTVARGDDVSISNVVATEFDKTSRTRLNRPRFNSPTAFRQLCTGRADVVETTRVITDQELALCRRNGVELLRNEGGTVVPLQLGAEAIVIATRNESDVGGDCLRKATVKDIFENGSNIDSWDQVGFDSLRLETTGRNSGTATFNLFASSVFDEPSADRTILRDDFRAKRTDSAVRDEVTGARRTERALARFRARLTRVRARTRSARQRTIDRAVARADRRALRVIRVNNRVLRDRKVELSAAQKRALERRNLRFVVDEKRKAEREAARGFDTRVVGVERRRLRRELNRLMRPGVVGFFRFAYYELFENLLRPMEIWDPIVARQALEAQGVATRQSIRVAGNEARGVRPGQSFTTAGGQKLTVPSTGPVDLDTTPICVFPSQRTISSGIYPLSQRVLVYVSRRALARSEVKEYLTFFLRDGQRLVERRRAVPVDDATREAQLRLINGERSTPQRRTGTGTGTTTTGTTTTTTPAPSQGAGGIPGVDSRAGTPRSVEPGTSTDGTNPTR